MKERSLAELNTALEFFNRSTGSLTEDDSTYTPVDGVFTTAQQVAHAAQTIDWFINGAFEPKGFDMDFEAHELEGPRGDVPLGRANLARQVGRDRPSGHRVEDGRGMGTPATRGSGDGRPAARGRLRRDH